MADNVFGNRFYGRDTPAWHGKGTVFTGKKTLVEAVAESGCDYDCSLEEMRVSLPNGDSVVLPDLLAVVRHPVNDDPEYRVIGQVSDHYQLVSNITIAQVFNPLSELWAVETVGALGKGETVFMSLDAGEVEINGDLIHQYYIITDNKIGKSATKVFYTPVRVVCQNTLTAGENRASITVKIRHSRGNIAQLQDIADLSVTLINRAEAINKLFGKMGKVQISLDDFKQAVEKLYPLPQKQERVIDVTTDFEYLTRKALESRQYAEVLYEKLNDEFPQNAGTAWHGYNAVVEWEDYKKSRGTGDIASLMIGERANTKATAFSMFALS